MASDAWQVTRDRLVQLWQRVQPHRADDVTAQLDAGRAETAIAAESDDQEVLAELRAEWQGRLRRLLAARPDAAAELRGLLDEIAREEPPGSSAVTQHATASGHARINQAGRDQHITER
ncbi:hypothetical protein [Streptomyces sp. NBC_00102]|uniref:hypothetical protein n=1 Tax=Streptomyces sp. NBC_00102 TaxID=2975652 RepID=UPI002B1E68FD|nr:hypothetical protein [Streptomyces sp. NBC_00102]